MIDEAEYFETLDALHQKNWPKGVPSEVSYPLGERPMSDYLESWAKKDPDSDAIIFYGNRISYGEFDRQSNAVANLLASRGIGKGDCVAVFLPNCPQFHFVFYGILKLGAIHVPVSPMSRGPELEHALNETGATVIIAQDSLIGIVREVRPSSKLSTVFTTHLADLLPDVPTMEAPDMLREPRVDCPDAEDLMTALANALTTPVTGADLDSVAALNFTGGTTGMPKGCMHSQRDMLFTAAANWSVTMCQDDAIVWLSFFGGFWIAGENSNLLYPVITGAPIVLMARWDPLAFMQAVHQYRASHGAVITDGAIEVMDHPRVSDFDLTALRRVRCISFVKKLNPDIRDRWRRLTGSTLIESSWGMTETHTANTFTTGLQEDDFDLHQLPIFVGLPIPETRIKICDFQTGEIVPLGTEGEIVVKNPALFKGYWRCPEASEKAIRSGWLHTADIGLIDESGYLHYIGRNKEMIKVNGMSVFPFEVEGLLGKHDAVIGSAVVARADPAKGQIPVAFVELKPDVSTTAEELRTWLKTRLASYKIPEIRILASLPKTNLGKPMKQKLAAVLQAEYGE